MVLFCGGCKQCEGLKEKYLYFHTYSACVVLQFTFSVIWILGKSVFFTLLPFEEYNCILIGCA